MSQRSLKLVVLFGFYTYMAYAHPSGCGGGSGGDGDDQHGDDDDDDDDRSSASRFDSTGNCSSSSPSSNSSLLSSSVGNGLSKAAVAGIVLGIIIALGLLLAIFFFTRRTRRRQRAERQFVDLAGPHDTEEASRYKNMVDIPISRPLRPSGTGDVEHNIAAQKELTSPTQLYAHAPQPIFSQDIVDAPLTYDEAGVRMDNVPLGNSHGTPPVYSPF